MNDHSPALQSLLFSIRQHAAFEELKNAVEVPRLPKYVPSKSDTLETMGAKTVFASGAIAQQERWLTFLTGQGPARDTQTSQQEKS